jgi:cell division protein ZapA (FtsZ GTPase activity inhibitor)
MTDKLNIRVVIGGREYPIKINPNEEESIRSAVKFIDEKVKEVEENYAVKDRRDSLAIALLFIVTELLNQKGTNVLVDNNIINDLKVLSEKIDLHLI